MYNENIKRRFLEECTSSNRNRSFRYFMSKVENFELENGLDIAEMDSDLAKRAIESVKVGEIGTLRKYLLCGKMYSAWCKDNEVFQNSPLGFDGISVDDIDMSYMSDILFRDEYSLISSIQKVHDLNSGYADAPVLVLSWLGLTLSEILELRDDDVDLVNRIIKLPEITVEGFSDGVYDVLYKYRACKRSTRDTGQGVQEVVKDMSVDSFIKRMAERGNRYFGTECAQNQINRQITRLVEKCEMLGLSSGLTISNAKRSGNFYRLWKAEQSQPIDKEVFSGIVRTKKEYYDTMRMYRWYKKAFNLE